MQFAASLPAQPYAVTGASASQQIANGRFIVTGVSGANIATTAVLLSLHDGQDSSGVRMGSLTIAASSGNDVVFGTTGVLAEIGIFLNMLSGTFVGTVWAIPLWHYRDTPPGT